MNVDRTMTRYLILFIVCFVSALHSRAQKYTAEKGMISFFSSAPIEDIRADNSSVSSLLNAGNGDIVYLVKIADFQFAKSLMRDHFNEKYMESTKFPKSLFQGKIKGLNINSTGAQKVTAVGKLAIHGVTHDVEIPGIIEVANGQAILKSKFSVKLKDYGIKIPTLVWQNIAEEIEVTVDIIYRGL
jgi:hypothetical protein